jgi:hypothetical protein
MRFYSILLLKNVLTKLNIEFKLIRTKAARYDDLRVLRFLLDNGAEVNAADDESGMTPLMWGNLTMSVCDLLF